MKDLYTHDPDLFHDNMIRGLKFCVEDFVSDFILDVDHIIEWPDCSESDVLSFKVVPGSLRFENVTDLMVQIIWPTSGYSSSVTGVQIDKIARLSVSTPMRFPNYYSWEISMTDGRSKISFGASASLFTPSGDPQIVNRQYLNDRER